MRSQRSLWFARQPGGGWRASVTGLFVLLLFAALFVAALVFLHTITRVIVAPLVFVTFFALAVGKTEFRRLDVE